jgi:hypothetical protein
VRFFANACCGVFVCFICSVFFFCCVLVLKLKTERHKKRKLGKTPLVRGYGVCFFESTRELRTLYCCLSGGVWEYEKQNTYLRLLEAWRGLVLVSLFWLVRKTLARSYMGEKSHTLVFWPFFFGSFFVFLAAKSGWGKRKGNERKRVRGCLANSPVVTWW